MAPTVGVGCGLVVLDGGRVLLLRRRKAPEAGYWSLVGGKVDFMEAAEAAAIRESAEEVGLVVTDPVFIGVSEQRLAEDGQHWISLLYRAGAFSGDARLLEPDKHSEIGWFDLDALPAPLAMGARHAIERLRAAPLPAEGS